MDKMILIVFDTERKAYEASRALTDLHRDGELAVYAAAVIAKDADGKISVKQAADQGPAGTTLGMATGALIGALAGPAGIAAGAVAGAVGGSMVDFVNAGVGVDFIEEASRELRPGAFAVVAEIDEDWVTPLDARIESLGGAVHRRPRIEVIDAQMERDAAALQAELDQLEMEYKQAKGEAKAKLRAKVDAARTRLEDARTRAKARMDAIQRETEARIHALHDQASKAAGDARKRAHDRIEELKAEQAARSDKLRQAWHLTKEAFSPAPSRHA